MTRGLPIHLGLYAAIAFSAGLTGCIAPTATVGPPVPPSTGTGPVLAQPGRTIKPPVKVSNAQIRATVQSYIGTPYRRGGMNRKGMDCSGFVTTIYRELWGVRLPRSTRQQKNMGRLVFLKNVKIGDLVFFRTGYGNTIDHVGIYVGNRRFAHASSTSGVSYGSLDERHHRLRAAFARRIF